MDQEPRGAPRARKRYGLLPKLGLSAGTVLVTLALAEVAVRVLAPAPAPLRFENMTQRAAQLRAADVTAGLVADPELFWRLQPDQRFPNGPGPFRGLVSNSAGLREDHEIRSPKPSGEIRILFIGDSCTFGLGVLPADTVSDVVEKTLRSRHQGRTLECINAGVPAYTLFQGWRFLETRGLDLEPDLVVATFGNNESVPWDGRSDPEHLELSLRQQPPPALRWSAVSGLVWRALAPGPTPTAVGEASSKRPRLDPEEFRTTLEKLRETTERAGIDLLLVTWPIRENLQRGAKDRHPLQQEILDFGRRFEFAGGAGALDLVPAALELARQHPVRDLYTDRIHTHAIANRRFAADVVARIEPWLEARK